MLCSRIPSVDMVRYCNSGTEAALFAIRAARAFSGKDIILKMDGGYHGTSDSVLVNAISDPSERDPLTSCLDSKGIPDSVLNTTLVVPFNDLRAVEKTLKEHEGMIAAIILEPMPGNGTLPPQEGYLKGMRELADSHGVLLIFDEVITFRLSLGGMQEVSGVEPDLTVLGKIIGGGFPVGALGGKKELMMQFDPNRRDSLFHTGTFSGNEITMIAGLAAMETYDSGAISRINDLGDRLSKGITGVFRKAGIKGRAIGLGSLVTVHWSTGEINNAKDGSMAKKSAGELPGLLHLEMMNRGIFTAPRNMYAVSTPMSEREIDEALKAFEETLYLLKPYAAEVTPHLLDEP